jgi:transglutaminase-like putative cysteine protease
MLYFAGFLALAAAVAMALSRTAQPGLVGVFVLAAVVGCFAGAPGLVRRRAWPLALVLLPLGAYLLVRVQVDLPADAHGAGGHLAALLDELRAGARTYAHERFPLDHQPGDGLAVLLSLTVYAITGLAAFLALSLRLAVPAIAVLLVALGFALTTDNIDRLVWAPLAFLVLAGCTLVLSRSLRRERWRATDALAGVVTGTVAAVLALSLLGATSVAAGSPLWDWTKWGIAGPGDAHVGFDWMQSYLRLLKEPSDAVVLRVRSPLASYWRANALTAFDGDTWFNGSSYAELTPASGPGGVAFAVPSRPPEPHGRLVTQSFETASTYTDHLFMGGVPRTVLLDAPEAALWATDAQALQLSRTLGPTLRYTVTAVVPQVKPADLVGRGRQYPPDVVLGATGLPFPAVSQPAGRMSEQDWERWVAGSPQDKQWLDLYRLNQAIVDGAVDPYRIALRIEDYLRTRYTYSLDPPVSFMDSPYAAFLLDTRTGYCQHFAGGMAALLRFNGVPSRVALGFTAGDKDADGRFAVTRKDAHAWVEAYFPGVGWVSFDPTPGRTIPLPGGSSASTGFVDPDETTSTAGPAAASPGPTARGADPGGASPGARGEPLPGSGMAAVPSGSFPWLPLGAALATVLVAWPVARLVRRAVSVRRGTYGRRLRTSLELLRAELRDRGAEVPPSLTLDETARLLRGCYGVDATATLDRAQAVLFGGRPPAAADVAAVNALRREVRRAARAGRGRLRACLALYGVRVGAKA